MSPRQVALIHGWGGSHAATFTADGWDDALRAAGFEPVGIDLPGHGPRGGSHDPADYADLASALAAMLPAGLLGCIGFSLGTKLLLELDIRQPGENGRLVLGGIGDNIFVPEAAGPIVAAALRGDTAETAPPPVRALLDYSRKSGSDPLCLAAVLEREPNPRISEERLVAARAPILLVNSVDDNVAMPDMRLRAALPHAEYLQLDGPDHVGLTSDQRFRQAAVDFMSRP